MLNPKTKCKKLALAMTIVATGVLPGSCALRLRDASLNGAANFVSTTVAGTLSGIINIDQFFGTN